MSPIDLAPEGFVPMPDSTPAVPQSAALRSPIVSMPPRSPSLNPVKVPRIPAAIANFTTPDAPEMRMERAVEEIRRTPGLDDGGRAAVVERWVGKAPQAPPRHPMMAHLASPAPHLTMPLASLMARPTTPPSDPDPVAAIPPGFHPINEDESPAPVQQPAAAPVALAPAPVLLPPPGFVPIPDDAAPSAPMLPSQVGASVPASGVMPTTRPAPTPAAHTPPAPPPPLDPAKVEELVNLASRVEGEINEGVRYKLTDVDNLVEDLREVARRTVDARHSQQANRLKGLMRNLSDSPSIIGMTPTDTPERQQSRKVLQREANIQRQHGETARAEALEKQIAELQPDRNIADVRGPNRYAYETVEARDVERALVEAHKEWGRHAKITGQTHSDALPFLEELWAAQDKFFAEKPGENLPHRLAWAMRMPDGRVMLRNEERRRLRDLYLASPERQVKLEGRSQKDQERVAREPSIRYAPRSLFGEDPTERHIASKRDVQRLQVDDPELDTVTGLGAAIVRGGLNIGSDASALAGGVMQGLDPHQPRLVLENGKVIEDPTQTPGVLGRAGRSAGKAADALAQEAAETYKSPEAQKRFNPGSVAWWLENTGEQLPQLAATLLTGGAGKLAQLAPKAIARLAATIGAASSLAGDGGQAMHSIRRALEAQGVDPQSANTTALLFGGIVGAVNAVMEKMNIQRQLRPGVGAAAVRQAMIRAGEAAAAEGGTEVMQGMTQQIAESIATGKPANWVQPIIEGVLATPIGALGGASGSVTQQQADAPPVGDANRPTSQPPPPPTANEQRLLNPDLGRAALRRAADAVPIDTTIPPPATLTPEQRAARMQKFGPDGRTRPVPEVREPAGTTSTPLPKPIAQTTEGHPVFASRGEAEAFVADHNRRTSTENLRLEQFLGAAGYAAVPEHAQLGETFEPGTAAPMGAPLVLSEDADPSEIRKAARDRGLNYRLPLDELRRQLSSLPPAQRQRDNELAAIARSVYQRDLDDAMRELQGVHIRQSIDPETGRQFWGHGVAGGLESLAGLLDGGIDPGRQLFSEPLAGGEGLLRDFGHFVVVGEPRSRLEEGGIRAVLVDGLYTPEIPRLQKRFPGVEFIGRDDAPRRLAEIAAAPRRSMLPPDASPSQIRSAARAAGLDYRQPLEDLRRQLEDIPAAPQAGTRSPGVGLARQARAIQQPAGERVTTSPEVQPGQESRALPAAETGDAASPLTGQRRRYTTFPREWVGAELFQWGTTPGLRKGKMLPTQGGRRGRYLTQAMQEQLERIPPGSQSLLDEVRKLTDEVWKVQGTGGGHHLAPKEAVAEATESLRARGIDPEREAMEFAAQREARRAKWRADKAERERKITGIGDELRRMAWMADPNTKMTDARFQSQTFDPANDKKLSDALEWAKQQPQDSPGYLMGYLYAQAKKDPTGTQYQWVRPAELTDGTEILIGKEKLIVEHDPDTGDVMLHDGVTLRVDENVKIPARQVREGELPDVEGDPFSEFQPDDEGGAGNEPAPSFFDPEAQGIRSRAQTGLFGQSEYDPATGKQQSLFHEPVDVRPPVPERSASEQRIAEQYDPAATAALPFEEANAAKSTAATKPNRIESPAETFRRQLKTADVATLRRFLERNPDDHRRGLVEKELESRGERVQRVARPALEEMDPTELRKLARDRGLDVRLPRERLLEELRKADQPQSDRAPDDPDDEPDSPAGSVAEDRSDRTPKPRPVPRPRPAETPVTEFEPKPAQGVGAAAGRALRPVQMPELVKLATELMGVLPEVEKLSGARGIFIGRGQGRIKVDPTTAKNPRQLAKTLAHEIGHLFDFLPDGDLARGNLLERVTSLKPILNNLGQLRGFLKNEMGELPTNSDLRRELMALSEWWRPGDMTSEYRRSSVELYADALSVLLNSPGELEARAPLFFKTLLEHLDQKPAVLDAYLTLQDLLAGTPEELAAARRADMREAFSTGEEKMRARAAERARGDGNIIEYVAQQLWDRAAPLLRREAQVSKKLGGNQRTVMKYAMEELWLADNVNHRFLDRVQKEVVAPALEAGATMEVLGEYMFLRRVMNERKAIANPWGHVPETAAAQMQSLRGEIGPRAFAAVEAAIAKLDDMVYQAAETAVQVGTYSQALFERTIKPNRGNYAAFSVLDYVQDRVPASIREQVGTFKDIANPFASTVMKTVSLNRLNELQKAKNTIREQMLRFFPQEFVKQDSPDARPGENKGMILILEDGKPVAYEADQYVAKVFAYHDIGALNRFGKANQWLTYKVFHPLFVTFAPIFHLRNIKKDFTRAWKNLSAGGMGGLNISSDRGGNVTVRRLLAAYFKAIPASYRRARGVSDAQIDQMLDEKALDVPFVSFDFDFGDSMSYDRLLQMHGLADPEQARTRLGRMLSAIGSGVEGVGVFLESLPKVAAYNLLGDDGIQGQDRAYIVRNRVGTPFIKRKGLSTNLTNGLFMYSNVFLQGFRADAEVAMSPTTRSGWWLKTAMLNVMPKLAMKAAKLGLLGVGLKALFDRIPDHDLASGLVIPLGMTEGEEEDEKKAVYLKLPEDETGRLVSGLAWHAMNFDTKNPMRSVQAILGHAFDQVPGPSPVIQMASRWGLYASGSNPPHTFLRNRRIISEEAWEAGGWHAAQQMLRWTIDQTGVISTIVNSVWPGRDGKIKQTQAETVIDRIPGLRNVIKFSDRGMTDAQWDEVAVKDEEDARFRLELPDSVRTILRHRYRLNRLGAGQLSEADRAIWARANAFYAEYIDVAKAMKSLDPQKDAKALEEHRAKLDRLARAAMKMPGAGEEEKATGMREGVLKSDSLTHDQQDRLLERLELDPPSDLALRRELAGLRKRDKEFHEAKEAAMSRKGDRAAALEKLRAARLGPDDQKRLKRLESIADAINTVKRREKRGEISAGEAAEMVGKLVRLARKEPVE